MIASATPSDVRIDAADANVAEGEAEDLGFGRAVLIGSGLGIVAMIGLLVVVLRLISPDMAWGATLGVAAWTGVWAGLFLGGTITVGRWAGARH